jgi:hypothetical protein
VVAELVRSADSEPRRALVRLLSWEEPHETYD